MNAHGCLVGLYQVAQILVLQWRLQTGYYIAQVLHPSLRFPAGLPELPEPPCINWLDSIKKLFVSWSGSNEKSASQQRPPGGVALAIAMRQAFSGDFSAKHIPGLRE